MQKIIKGRKYDTDTAQEVCGYSNGLPSGDFDALCEQLYVKRTGEFFLYGYGGARTAYAEADGNMWTSGEKIVPLYEADAKAFAEEHALPEVYEQYFGEVSEGDTYRTTITLSAGAKKKLQSLALERRENISQIVERLIENA